VGVTPTKKIDTQKNHVFHIFILIGSVVACATLKMKRI